jgi:hypothetical protein
MTFGINAFLTNADIVADILSEDEVADLLKKIPKFDIIEPELARFYKDMAENNSKNNENKSIRWCFPKKKATSEYQAMHYGIIAFVSNKELTTGIMKTSQITALLKKIPMYEEPDVQAKFYKELIKRKNIMTEKKNNRWRFFHPVKSRVVEETFNINNNVNVFVTDTDQHRESELTRGSYESNNT